MSKCVLSTRAAPKGEMYTLIAKSERSMMVIFLIYFDVETFEY